MKMFTVWGVVLFCGFLGLSAGEECLEGMGRLSKAKMERAVEFVLSAADIPGQVENLFKAQPEGKKLPAYGQKSAPSSSGMKCEFKNMPKVNITMNSDKTMNAKINATLSMETSDGTMVDVDMYIILVLALAKDGIKVTDCSISPKKEDVRISHVKGITEPMKKMVDQMVKDQVVPLVYQNMCTMVKTGLETPITGEVTKQLEVPDGMNFKIQDMKEKETHFEYLVLFSKSGGGESEEDSCMSRTHTSWEPDCPLNEDALADLAINNTDIEKHIRKMESHPIPLNSPEGADRSFSIEDVRMVESPEGPILMYKPKFASCKPEDPSDCEYRSADPCSMHVKMAAEDNTLKMSPGSGSCDKDTEPDQDSDDHDSMCHKANCKVASSMKGLQVALPGPMGTMADITANNCGTQTVMSASVPMLTQD